VVVPVERDGDTPRARTPYKNLRCRLLKKTQKRGARQIDEWRRTRSVRRSEAIERNEAYEAFSAAC
jgi:hypothetical protein